MTNTPEKRAGTLASRMPHVPAMVVERMRAHLRHSDFPQRGMPAVLEDFYARLERAGCAPEQVATGIFRDVATSRSRFRCLVAALRHFAPEVPLAAATPVKQDWDSWLNARYNRRPKVNTGDRQGDIRHYRIGIELLRDEEGNWCHGIRQGKTGRPKELEALWPGTSTLIDDHVLGDRPAWQMADRLAELEGRNLLSLSDRGVNKGFINRRLAGEFGIHGHLVRTLIADLLRRTRPEALWALQAMLGHTDRHTQRVYRSEFDESRAVGEVDALLGQLAGAPRG